MLNQILNGEFGEKEVVEQIKSNPSDIGGLDKKAAIKSHNSIDDVMTGVL